MPLLLGEHHVFVLDDDPALLRLSSLTLQLEGLDVQPFSSPLAALEKLEDPSYPNPPAIVLDLDMPEMDGREFYRQAREAGFAGAVLILSACGASAAQAELGADAALAKPFHPQELASSLKRLIESPEGTA